MGLSDKVIRVIFSLAAAEHVMVSACGTTGRYPAISLHQDDDIGLVFDKESLFVFSINFRRAIQR